MNNKVSVVKCDRYSEVQNAVENAVSLIGGIGKFVKKGDNVVIKPNLVSKKKSLRRRLRQIPNFFTLL